MIQLFPILSSPALYLYLLCQFLSEQRSQSIYSVVFHLKMGVLNYRFKISSPLTICELNFKSTVILRIVLTVANKFYKKIEAHQQYIISSVNKASF